MKEANPSQSCSKVPVHSSQALQQHDKVDRESDVVTKSSMATGSQDAVAGSMPQLAASECLPSTMAVGSTACRMTRTSSLGSGHAGMICPQ